MRIPALKLLVPAVALSIFIVMSARSTHQAVASVGSITPATFVATANAPTSFTFSADPGAGVVTIGVSTVVPTALNASCAGCTVSGNGTPSLSITPPQGSSPFTVSFTLTVACTASGAPITLTASQGNSTQASGSTGTCGASCPGGLAGCATTCSSAVLTLNCCGAYGGGGCCALIPGSCQLVVQGSGAGSGAVAGVVAAAGASAQAQATARAQASQVAAQQAAIAAQAQIAPPNTGDGGLKR